GRLCGAVAADPGVGVAAPARGSARRIPRGGGAGCLRTGSVARRAAPRPGPRRAGRDRRTAGQNGRRTRPGCRAGAAG
ncbi:hypothetical protein B8W90_13250, partial [Staphylococcus hominis]